MVFESILQWYAKQLAVDGVDVSLIIGLCFSYPHFEAIESYLYGIRDSVAMEGSIPCVPRFDAAFDDSLGKSLTSAGDGIFTFIESITYRVSL